MGCVGALPARGRRWRRAGVCTRGVCRGIWFLVARASTSRLAAIFLVTASTAALRPSSSQSAMAESRSCSEAWHSARCSSAFRCNHVH